MSYYSFYGGKPGITYDIRAHFPSIQAMCNAFSQGNNYTDVLYGEYVIIDTVNKTDTTNGILYRRSGNFNEPITSPIDRYHPGAGACRDLPTQFSAESGQLQQSSVRLPLR